MAKSTSFGTKRIPAESDRAREITRFIDERRSRSATNGRYYVIAPSRDSSSGKSRRSKR